MSVNTRTRVAPMLDGSDFPPAPAIELPPAPPELPPAPPDLPPAPPELPSAPPRAGRRWPLAVGLSAAAVAVAVIAAVIVTRGGDEPGAGRAGGGIPAADGTIVPAPETPNLVSRTADAVEIRWVSSGAAIDGYVVLRDGSRAGDVGPTIRRFRDTGLVPDTTYRYAVMAQMDGGLSTASDPLVVRTDQGTLASALVAGTWKVKMVIGSESNFESLSAGSRHQGRWDLRQTGSGVRMSGDLFGGGFVTALLRGGGPAYRGTAREQLSQCGLTPVTDTVDIAITVTRGATRAGQWRAVALRGTVEDFSPGASWGALYCGDSSYTASFTARPA